MIKPPTLTTSIALFTLALTGCGDSSDSSGDSTTDGETPAEAPTNPTMAREVIFSELMANPLNAQFLGEWIEVRNATTGEFNLRDCVFTDAASGNFIVDIDLIIGPGEHRTFAISTAPGFTPDFSYNNSGLTLENTSDTVTLSCNGVRIDSRTYSNPVIGGSSALSNNGNGKWCNDLSNPYPLGGTGTPGTTNINCP